MTHMTDEEKAQQLEQERMRRLNQALEANGLRTVEKFSADATDLLRRHGNPLVFAGHLQRWENERYSPEGLKLNILSLLEFKRHELGIRQVRGDESTARLRQIIADLKNGTILQYFEDIATARELVDWCNAYVTIAAMASII